MIEHSFLRHIKWVKRYNKTWTYRSSLKFNNNYRSHIEPQQQQHAKCNLTSKVWPLSCSDFSFLMPHPCRILQNTVILVNPTQTHWYFWRFEQHRVSLRGRLSDGVRISTKNHQNIKIKLHTSQGYQYVLNMHKIYTFTLATQCTFLIKGCMCLHHWLNADLTPTS